MTMPELGEGRAYERGYLVTPHDPIQEQLTGEVPQARIPEAQTVLPELGEGRAYERGYLVTPQDFRPDQLANTGQRKASDTYRAPEPSRATKVLRRLVKFFTSR